MNSPIHKTASVFLRLVQNNTALGKQHSFTLWQQQIRLHLPCLCDTSPSIKKLDGKSEEQRELDRQDGLIGGDA